MINFKNLFYQILTNFVDINALARLFRQSLINFVDINALARIFGQSLIKFVDINTLARLKFYIIDVLNAFLHV